VNKYTHDRASVRFRLLGVAPLVAAIMAAATPSTSVTLRGRVTEMTTGRGVHWANVTVLVPGSGAGAVTDSLGAYSVTFSPPQGSDSVRVRVRRIGYMSKVITLALKGRDDIVADAALTVDARPSDCTMLILSVEKK